MKLSETYFFQILEHLGNLEPSISIFWLDIYFNFLLDVDSIRKSFH